MTQTNLSPEVEKWLEDHPAASRTMEPEHELVASKPERTRADRRSWPRNVRSWTGVDWLILAAMLSCVALLVKLVAG
jgi:hypothetical protein